MRKLILEFPFASSSLAIAQAAAEVPIEPTVGAGALVAFAWSFSPWSSDSWWCVKSQEGQDSEAAGGK
jgi:hypothetical protein